MFYNIGSRSHVFFTFFKIFFLVVTFGLFQGLVLLPIVLSFCGPISTKSQATVAPKPESPSRYTSHYNASSIECIMV